MRESCDMSVRWTQGECRAGTSSSAPGKGEEGLMDGAGLYHGTSEVKLDKLEEYRSPRTLSSWAFNPECLNGVVPMEEI